MFLALSSLRPENMSFLSQRSTSTFACMREQVRTQGGGWGLNLPLSLIFYKSFITCAKGINCFHILFAC